MTTPKLFIAVNRNKGILIAVSMISIWCIVLYLNLNQGFSWSDPLSYLRLLIQTHLFTGLFITAHDAMHGTVAPNSLKVNHFIGRICTLLFIFNSYKALYPKHHLHHQHAGTSSDPDFHKGNSNVALWYFDFLKEYISWKQILLAAITFNLAKLWFTDQALIAYWIIPSLLATFQLFYFGTYRPHKGQHDDTNPHNARSQSKNHLLAFLSCYFFGYHFEHHDSPATAWWQLWQLKE